MTDGPGPLLDGSHRLASVQVPAAVNSLAEACATEEWQAAYFAVSQQGTLTEQRVTVRVPAGLERVCPPVPIGADGCVYGVRHWGFILRPSALEAAGFDPTSLADDDDQAASLGAMLRAATYELPGEYVIASPEHPFRLIAHDGILRGSSTRWRTYLGALAFFASGGKVDQAFIRFWAEARASYDQAVDHCLASLRPLPQHRP